VKLSSGFAGRKQTVTVSALIADANGGSRNRLLLLDFQAYSIIQTRADREICAHFIELKTARHYDSANIDSRINWAKDVVGRPVHTPIESLVD